MADHLGAIGLVASDESSFGQLLDAIIDKSTEERSSGQYRHLLWVDPSGAAAYSHLDTDTQTIECITPFFAPAEGLARWRVKTSEYLDDAECPHCGGADCDIVDEDGETITRSAVQWAMYQPYRDWLEREQTFELEVVVFAHTIDIVADEETFASSPANVMGKDDKGEPLRLASNAFLPFGMFAEGNDMSERSIARINGRIVAAERRTNQLTDQPFWQIRIDALPGPTDIVVAADMIENEPQPGAYLAVLGWLVGRPVVAPLALH